MTDKKIAVIVAHPDDETLWTGGTILGNRSWNCFVIALCRGSDRDRAPKFLNALNDLYANGRIGDMDDGPEQIWLKKYGIITKTCGFGEDSFEAITAPRTEAFWQFSGADEARDFFRILP